MLNQDLVPGLKGFPHGHAPVACGAIGELGWNVLDGRLPLPLAVIKRTALEHNLQWIFDLVAGRLRPTLGRPVRGLLRSGCYVTHDHGHGRRMMAEMQTRCDCADALRPALEVWTHVQSCPEPGLALLTAGRRDLSFDVDLPFPLLRSPRGSLQATPVPFTWKITALNDQHAYLRWDAAQEALAPVVGERIALGISHPCTTFDKWQWMPIVEDDYRVTDAVTIHF